MPGSAVVLGVAGALLLGAPQLQQPAAAYMPRGTDCFEYGYTYHGYDIQQDPFVLSPLACMDRCAAQRGCGFWSFDSISRICYLKSAGAMTTRHPASAMISGPKQCLFSHNCLEVGMDYYGHDIEKIEGRYIMSPHDCQRLCAANPQCAFFSWKKSEHSCYLKSASATIARREDADVTSGPRTCIEGPALGVPSPDDFPLHFDPSTAPKSCVKAGVEYRGYNVKTLKTRSAAACQRECQQHRDCRHWTWSAQSNLCSLKNEEATRGRTEGPTTLDKVSAEKNCIPVIPGCQFANVGVIGSRLTKRQTNSFDVCQLYCAMRSGCTHFTHDLISSECTLWSSFHAYAQGASTEGLVSGPAFCNSEEVCYEQSDYVGNNVDEIETGEVTSPAACQQLCRQNDDCHYWTWFRDINSCYLKDANALTGRSNDVTTLGRFSGPKHCNVKFGCLNINAVYTGIAFEQEEAEDYKACAAACSSNPFCAAWTYHTTLKHCSLFSGDASLAVLPVRGAISGTNACGGETEEEDNCFDEGIAYDLDSIMGMGEAQTAAECYARCQLNEKCKWWTLRNFETCYLMSAVEQPSFVFDPNSTSGPKQCSGDSYIATDKKEVEGGIIAKHYTYTPGACMKKCAVTPNCLNWQYSPGAEYSCTLQDKSGTVVSSTSDSIVGQVPPPTLLATGCSFRDPVGSVSVSSAEECQVECLFNRQCEGWQTAPAASRFFPDGSAALTCTLFKSTDNPLRLRDASTKCGPKIPLEQLFLGSSAKANALNVRFQTKVDTMLQCYNLCLESEQCVAWTFPVGSECTGYSTISLKSPPSGLSGFMRSPPTAFLFNVSFVPVENKQQQRSSSSSSRALRFKSQFRRRLAPKTTAPAPQPAADFNACIDICHKDPNCTAWTFKDGACSVFYVAAVPTADPGAISSRRSTPKVNWQFELNKKCIGEPLQTLPGDDPSSAVPSAMDCASKASSTGFFTFKQAAEGPVCSIYAACEETEEEEGAVSGKNSSTQSDAKQPEQAEEEELYSQGEPEEE